MSLMTAALRVRIKKEIDAIARARNADGENVLICPSCSELYDKGYPKECSCRRSGREAARTRARARKVASPLVA